MHWNTLGAADLVVLDTLLPSDAHPTLRVGVLDAGYERFFSQWVHDAPLTMVLGFRVALLVANWISPLLIKSPPPLARLDRDTREAALTALATSDVAVLREMNLILRACTCFCYGGDQRVRDSVGFPRQFDDPRGPIGGVTT